MPAGKKSKKRQRSKNKKRRQLLERSRRSRDDLINSALEDTDLVAVTPRGLRGSLNISCTSILCDPIDLAFGTPSGGGDGLRRPLFINSTPRRRRSSVSPAALPRRRLSNPNTCLVLSPVLSVDDELDKSLVQQDSISSTANHKWIQIKFSVISFLNSISAFFCKLYFSITSIHLFDSKKHCDDHNFGSKLDEILNKVTELNMKQDKFYERQETLFHRLASLEAKMSKGGVMIAAPPQGPGGPPPPPPPPPPLPMLGNLETPQPLVFVRKAQNPNSEAAKRNSRPSITLEDILGVQLKKTPAVKPFGERTPMKGSAGQRGPLVSVDLLRSVKLKPASLRRHNLERPLQSPSTIFLDKAEEAEELEVLV